MIRALWNAFAAPGLLWWRKPLGSNSQPFGSILLTSFGPVTLRPLVNPSEKALVLPHGDPMPMTVRQPAERHPDVVYAWIPMTQDFERASMTG